MRWILTGGKELLSAEAGNPHHTDVTVAPWLLGNPFDQIITIPLARAAVVGFTDSTWRADNVDVAPRDEELGVAGLEEARPKRRPCGLRRQSSCHVRALQILVVDRER